MQNKRPEWLKSRGYIHVSDKFGGQEIEKLELKITNPNWVARHAFFPLLKKEVKTRKFKKMGYSDDGKPIRAHFNHKKRETNAKIRPIEYATHIDTAVFSYYAKEVVGPRYDKKLRSIEGLSNCITAYRKVPIDANDPNSRCKSNIHFAAEVFNHILEKGACVAMAFDIDSFFPNLDHKILKKAWSGLFGKVNLEPDQFNIFKGATRYSFINIDEFRKQKPKAGRRKVGFDEQKFDRQRKQKGSHSFFESPREMRESIKSGEIRLGVNNTRKGIPHGLPISSVLANLYMLAFDQKFFEEIGKKYHAFYRRYSDDIIVVCDKKDYVLIKSWVETTITELALTISEAKTEVCFFEFEKGELRVSREITTVSGKKIMKPNMPLVYLGFEFYGNKTLIKSANLAKFYRRMKHAVKSTVNHAVKSAKKEGREKTFVCWRKLRRLYTYHGAKGRKWEVKNSVYKYDSTLGIYKPQMQEEPKEKKYRGNTLSYVYRADKIMPLSGIRKQFRRCWSIFKSTIDKCL